MQVPQVNIRLNFDAEWVAEQERIAAALAEEEKKAKRKLSTELPQRKGRRLVSDKKGKTLKSVELIHKTSEEKTPPAADREKRRQMRRESAINLNKPRR